MCAPAAAAEPPQAAPRPSAHLLNSTRPGPHGPFGPAPQYPGTVKFLGNGSVLLVGCVSGDIDVVRVRPDGRGGESVAVLQGHVQDCVAIAADPTSE